MQIRALLEKIVYLYSKIAPSYVKRGRFLIFEKKNVLIFIFHFSQLRPPFHAYILAYKRGFLLNHHSLVSKCGT
jgi:hypothetical protein